MSEVNGINGGKVKRQYRKKKIGAEKAGHDNRSSTKFDSETGTRIRLRRVELGISQDELGSKLGVSFQQIQKYERGVNRVSAARLQKIATALDVPVTFFFGGTEKSKEVESLLFIDSAFSLRLLRAYTKVENQVVQRQFVALLESIAAEQ